MGSIHPTCKSWAYVIFSFGSLIKETCALISCSFLPLLHLHAQKGQFLLACKSIYNLTSQFLSKLYTLVGLSLLIQKEGKIQKGKTQLKTKSILLNFFLIFCRLKSKSVWEHGFSLGIWLISVFGIWVMLIFYLAFMGLLDLWICM